MAGARSTQRRWSSSACRVASKGNGRPGRAEARLLCVTRFARIPLHGALAGGHKGGLLHWQVGATPLDHVGSGSDALPGLPASSAAWPAPRLAGLPPALSCPAPTGLPSPLPPNGDHCRREVSADSPEARLPLHGPNVWPPERLMPGFRSATADYFSAVTSLGFRLLRLLAASLNLPPDHFDRMFDPPMVFLRPLRYSGEVSRPGDGVFGAGAHSDYVSASRAAAGAAGAREGRSRGPRRQHAPHAAGSTVTVAPAMLQGLDTNMQLAANAAPPSHHPLRRACSPSWRRTASRGCRCTWAARGSTCHRRRAASSATSETCSSGEPPAEPLRSRCIRFTGRARASLPQSAWSALAGPHPAQGRPQLC